MLARTFGFTSALALVAAGLAATSPAHAAPAAGMTVYRAQLYVRVCDVADAGTDRTVEASLRYGNATVMNYGRDDFERNSSFTYDLKLDGISRIEDVTRLHISRIGGDDAIKLCYVELRINNRAIYGRSFGTGLWLDADGKTQQRFLVSRTTMASGSLWINYSTPLPPLAIPRAETESRVEALVGDGIDGTGLYWGRLNGSRWVEAIRKDSRTVAVDLDLAYALPALPDPGIDVDIDLVFACSNGVLTVTPKLVRVDGPWWFDIFGSAFNFESKVKRQFANRVKAIETRIGFCPRITILSDGTVSFSL
ncbi:MAG: hypothetical protein AB1689_03720 [Thermodesulfobacteriota bacterium]